MDSIVAQNLPDLQKAASEEREMKHTPQAGCRMGLDGLVLLGWVTCTLVSPLRLLDFPHRGLIKLKSSHSRFSFRWARLTQVVERLTHLTRHIPVTVLAVYPDQTCDVELASNFVAAWESAPHKPFSLQGSVVIGEHMDISDTAIRAAPVGAGDVGERVRRRVLLKGIALGSLASVQAASFNIYDAAITTTDEIVRIHPHKATRGMWNSYRFPTISNHFY